MVMNNAIYVKRTYNGSDRGLFVMPNPSHLNRLQLNIIYNIFIYMNMLILCLSSDDERHFLLKEGEGNEYTQRIKTKKRI